MKTGLKGTIAIASALFIAGVAHQASAGFDNFAPRGQYSTCSDTQGNGNVVVGHACIGNDPFCDIGTKQVAAFCNGNDCAGEFVDGIGCPTQNEDSSCAEAISSGATVTSSPASVPIGFSACRILINFD
jgi:hypothetical protein